MNKHILKTYIQEVYELKEKATIISRNPYDTVEVYNIPKHWVLLGVGNYASVLRHHDYPELVVKIYAEGKNGYKEEVEVYNKLGYHPNYSECYYAKDNFLVLKYLEGVTLYDAVHKGIKIPIKVIKDIDNALEFAFKQGLYPHDVHGKNVMMYEGRGYVVDISDFYKKEKCNKWKDLKKAYYKFYQYTLYHYPIPIPYFLLTLVRKGYRFYRVYINKENPSFS